MTNMANLIFISALLFSRGKETSNVEEHLLNVVTAKVQQECVSCRVELEILNGQVLEDISVPDKVIADHWKGQTNLLLKLGDESRLVTTRIRWKDNVVIAKKNIRQGKILDKQDLKTIEKDVTFLQTPYLSSFKSAQGMAGRRLFKRGEILDESLLRHPIVVKFGQPLELVLKKGGLQVQVMGKARGAGAIGDRIPVFIGRTRTKVFAKILNKNQARVE